MSHRTIALICSVALSLVWEVQPAFSSMEGGSADSATSTQQMHKRRLNGRVSFRADILPLFRDNCTMCHHGDIPMGALDLTPDFAFDSLVGMHSSEMPLLRVTPGSPQKSYLFIKASGQNAKLGGKGFGMPMGAPLAAIQIDLLRRWIEQGAKNN